jgi:hypothetical protein
VSRRVEWTLAIPLVVALVAARAFPFVAWPGAHFDSDQAIVGLMAKHISEGRAFPLYYYGQNYMLGVEAWLAAPAMLALGPTVTALKLPLVAINIAVVLLLVWIAVRDVGLRPGLALLAVLPVAIPAAPIAARVVEANGGNVEPWLYVPLLWVLRERPWTFGLVLGVGGLHREFTFYGALALVIMDAAGVLWSARRTGSLAIPTDLVSRWAVAAVVTIAVRSVAAALQPFANALGPGSRGDDPGLLRATVETIGGRLCFDPGLWPSRAWLLITDHLPRMIGGVGAPLNDYGVLTGVYSGTPGLGPWVGLLVAAGLGGAAVAWARSKSQTLGFPVFLLLVGLISTTVYGFATCGEIRVATLRYDLLVVFVPVAALLMALAAWPSAPVRAGIGAGTVLWCLLNLSDLVALNREYLIDPPADQRQALATALERRGVTIARSLFRTAYHVTFLARERVRLTAEDFVRIQEYQRDAQQPGVPTVTDAPCAGGERVLEGVYLCR